MKPRNMSYEEFPASTETAPGIRVVPTSRQDFHVVYHENVPYIKRNGQYLRLQILAPEYAERKTGKFPCVVYVKGSGWRRQELYRTLPSLALFARRGYVVALVEYRHSGLAPFPAQVEDAKTAVRFMKRNAEQYGLDPENVFLWGDSSGGHVSLLAGFTREIGEFETADFEGVSSSVKAVVDYYGPANLITMGDYPSISSHTGPGSPEGLLLGRVSIPENPEKAKAASPVTYIKPGVPPVLILHGDKDRRVPFNQSVTLYNALKAVGCDCEFVKLEGADHGGPQFWTDDVLDLVDGFLRRCIEKV